MKRMIDVYDYMNNISKALKGGILITTKQDKVNPMSISWGKIGIEWNKLIFITYVRQSRFTKEQLDATNEFTVNIPIGDFDRKIISYCGTKSGRDVDKVKDLGLHTVAGDSVDVPGIRELPLTLECKVIYKQDQDINKIPEELQNIFYPEDEHNIQDYHTAYFGEVVNAYIIED